ncbi:MAG: hypothetical protein CNIPEHKO_03117 [Anaerolineales bacterium]|nr:hypothetical protein [Anaerolineales bacterium]
MPRMNYPDINISKIGKVKRRRSRKKLTLREIELTREVFGMWSDRKDITDNWLDKGRAKWKSDFSADQSS